MAFKDPAKKTAYHKKYSAEHYLKNREKYRARTAAARRKIVAWFADLKSKLKCSRCPESHPACLDFHHLGGKDYPIADMVSSTGSKRLILAEIAKCIVLCANCHRKEHAGLDVPPAPGV